jgi:hypothetical protein
MTDIEELLAAAADDSDRPPAASIDDIVERGRRSVRQRRLAAVTTAVVAGAVIVGGATAWSATRSNSVGPAGQTITVDTTTGKIVDNDSGKTATSPIGVSPLSDAEVLNRCKQYDGENVDFLREQKANVWDKAGVINARWKVVLKAGDQNMLDAVFLSPDGSIASTCTMDDAKHIRTNGRPSTTRVEPLSGSDLPETQASGVQAPSGVTRVLVDIAGEVSPREARVGDNGFFTIGHPPEGQEEWGTTRIRGYDADGKQVFEQNRVSALIDKPTTNYNLVRIPDLKAWPTTGGWPNDRIYPAPPKVPSAELVGQLEGKQVKTVLVDLDGGKTQRLTMDDFRASRFDLLIEGRRQRFVPFRIRGLDQDGQTVYDELAEPSKIVR